MTKKMSSAERAALALIEAAAHPGISATHAAELIKKAKEITEPKSRPKTSIVVVIDESGSMGGLRGSTIEGINTAMAKLREELTDHETLVSLLTFDTTTFRPPVRYLAEAMSIGGVPVLHFGNYTPSGGTPLYDAVAQAIAVADRQEERLGECKTIVIVQTDGEENSSKEYPGAAGLAKLKSMIEARKAKGWEIQFMGANLGENAYRTSMGLGINVGTTRSYTGANTVEAFSQFAQNVAAFATGVAASTAYTAGQKAAVGDKWDPEAKKGA